MKKILLSYFIFLSVGTFAQINIDVKKCNYDGNDVFITLEIQNKSSTSRELELDSSINIMQLPSYQNGNEFRYRFYGRQVDAFVLFYKGDTLIKDIPFYTIELPTFTSLHLPSKSSVERGYKVTIIGEKTRELLNKMEGYF